MRSSPRKSPKGYDMTDIQIARALGLSRNLVNAALQSGLEKLRARPRAMSRIRELAHEHRRLMDARIPTHRAEHDIDAGEEIP